MSLMRASGLAIRQTRAKPLAAQAARIQAVLRGEHLGQPEVLTAAYAATTRAAVAVLGDSRRAGQGPARAGRCALWSAPPTLRSACPSLV